MADLRFKAGEKLEASGRTMAFARDVFAGDPLTVDCVSEIDGESPHIGQVVPHEINENYAVIGV